MTVESVIDWLGTLRRPSLYVGVDEGGLTLVAANDQGVTTGAYLEVGGICDTEMPWCKWCKSYHVVPQNREHWAKLQCRAPWKSPVKPRRTRTIGICEDAKTLGVTREHLYRVLKGERRSKSLTKRYWQLQRKDRQ